MPIYEYQCESCGERTEVIQKFDDAPLAECPACGGPMRKLLSAPAFQFKGTGWYVTDYAGKSAGSRASGENGEKAEKAEKSGKAESGAPSEGKSEGRSEGKSESKAETKSSSDSAAKSDSAGKSESKSGSSS